MSSKYKCIKALPTIPLGAMVDIQFFGRQCYITYQGKTVIKHQNSAIKHFEMIEFNGKEWR